MTRTVLLTGGSAGIGRGIVQALLETSHRVISLDVMEPPSLHEDYHHVPVDLLDAAATQRAALDAAERWRPTTLVHNAGAMRPALLADVERADLDALVSLHLGAAITLVQAVLPAMREDGFGRVVLISSRAVLGLPTRTSYSATKAGMIGMARTWALELGPQGVTVNVIAPGPVETDMFHVAQRRAIGRAYRAVLGKHYPAMSVIGVSRLVEKQALVEIEATAMVDKS